MSEHIIPSQQTPEEVESLIADMELIAKIASDDEYHTPRNAEIKAKNAATVKTSLADVLADAEQAKALFVVMITDDNNVVTAQCGDVLALTRTVMCVGEENRILAKGLAAGLRQAREAVAKAEEEATKDSVDGSSC